MEEFVDKFKMHELHRFWDAGELDKLANSLGIDKSQITTCPIAADGTMRETWEINAGVVSLLYKFEYRFILDVDKPDIIELISIELKVN